MESEPEAREREREPGEAPKKPIPRPLKLVLLGAGLVVALYFGAKAPRDQHVRLVLGDRAPDVTGVSLQYVPEAHEGADDVAREARLAFPEGAPRVVPHDPALADGEYRVRIDLDTRQGRRSVERRVRLGGGSTQIDLAAELARPLTSAQPR
ncbi:MAG: hypothetical protein JST00_34065 [Deltaproteobacteria bacterium]|nr:hypothetical protein [Deltaproteobacteria bacterium]